MSPTRRSSTASRKSAIAGNARRRGGPRTHAPSGVAYTTPIPSAEGVDANASKRHLLDVARRLGVRGRSTMDKTELVEAIKKYNRRVRGR